MRSEQKTARALKSLLDCPVYSDPLRLALYSTDASIYQVRPCCVVLPRSTEDVVKVIEFAAENGIPVAARGSGSGLAGESLCSGIILDTTRYLNSLLEFDADAGTVRCQPGLILERLNAAVAPAGWKFGPDPASASRASIGGVIGNNSTGSHSIRYGYADAYIESLQVVLADGRVATLRPRPLTELNGPSGDTPDNCNLEKTVADLLLAHRDLIARYTPRSQRNRAGYALDKALDDAHLHLHRLIAGSEGTLAVVTEATLRLVRLPKRTGLLQLHFRSLDDMARAVPVLWSVRPATCELIDAILAGLARAAYPHHRDALPPEGVAASLLIEFDDDDGVEIEEKMRLAERLVPWSASVQRILDPAHQRAIWQARKDAVPLLFRRPDRKQPIPFIEDAAVPVEAFPEYMRGLQEILNNRHKLEVCYYAHAGHGEIHIRPFLDLHDPRQVEKMCRVAEEVYELVWSLGGTISGEHGEGLARVQFAKRQFGPLYDLMRQVKKIFDPAGILNPGKKITDDNDVMCKNLRFAHRALPERTRTRLIFRDDEFVREIEQCNGNGACRSFEPHLSMCPVFRVLQEEEASPRGHANLMRHYVTGLLDEQVLRSREFKRMVSLCANCKMCSHECPSLVNVPKLMVEARARCAALQGLSRTEWFLTRSEMLSAMGSIFAPVANLLNGLPPARWLMEKLTGIDRRRKLPCYHTGSFLLRRRLSRMFGSSASQPAEGFSPERPRVAYFLDLYANYNDHDLAKATIAVLEHNGVEVCIPPQTGCGMPTINYGDLELARKYLKYNIKHLSEAVREGYIIVCTEPTAALCLKEEYLWLDDSAEARLVAENTYEFGQFLLRLHEAGALKTDFKPLKMHLGYHAPCHLKALQIGTPSLELLRLIPHLRITPLNAGCCGIAGTFGFQKKNFDISMQAGQRLFEALADESIDCGVTECSTCNIQMQQGAGKQVLHPAKVLAMAYGIET